jgi:ABC-type sugar transport system substrate-binding protein
MSTRTPVVRWSRRSTVVAAVAAVVTAGAVVGCGSSDTPKNASATSNSSSATKSTLSEAQQIMKQGTARPSAISVETPLAKPIPSGKKLVFISCGTSSCQLQGDIIKKAAGHLGWSSQTVATDGSPAQVQGAFTTALRNGANAVIVNAQTRDGIAKQLAQAEAKGVAYVGCCSTDTVGDGYLYNTSTPDQNARIGKYLAAAIASDAGGKDASTLYVDIPAFTILGALGESFKADYERLCQGCKYSKIDIALPQLANAPNTIVSYLRSHPDVKYVSLSVTDALGTGLPAALKAAGLNDIKIVGQGGDPTAFQALKQGQMLALVPFDYFAVDYQMVDALARHWTGTKVEQTAPPLWLLTKDNLPSDYTKLFPNVGDYESQFLKLWGKA